MTEKRSAFLGTYFDRDTVIRLARLVGVLAWVLLGIYVITVSVSFMQFLTSLLSGMMMLDGMSIFDRINMFTIYLVQIVPGVLYFVLMKVAQQVLLLLLDVEDNSRRAARGQIK